MSNLILQSTIIKYKSPLSKKSNLFTKLKEKHSVTKQLQNGLYEVIKIDEGTNEKEYIESLSKNDNVESVSPNYELQQFGNDSASLTKIDDNFWAEINDLCLQEGGSEIVVGIIDSGINIDSNSISNNIYTNKNEIPDNNIDDDNNGFVDDNNGWNFVNNTNEQIISENEHGQRIAEIITGTNLNYTGTLLPENIKILPLQTFNNSLCKTSDVIEAIDYAKSIGVQIVNCSWGCSEYNYALKEAMLVNTSHKTEHLGRTD